MLTALIFIIAIAFEIVGVLAYMVGAIALWAIATCELAELHVWAPYFVGFTKRKMAIEAIEIAAGGFTLFLFGLYVITRIISA